MCYCVSPSRCIVTSGFCALLAAVVHELLQSEVRSLHFYQLWAAVLLIWTSLLLLFAWYTWFDAAVGSIRSKGDDAAVTAHVLSLQDEDNEVADGEGEDHDEEGTHFEEELEQEEQQQQQLEEEDRDDEHAASTDTTSGDSAATQGGRRRHRRHTATAMQQQQAKAHSTGTSRERRGGTTAKSRKKRRRQRRSRGAASTLQKIGGEIAELGEDLSGALLDLVGVAHQRRRGRTRTMSLDRRRYGGNHEASYGDDDGDDDSLSASSDEREELLKFNSSGIRRTDARSQSARRQKRGRGRKMKLSGRGLQGMRPPFGARPAPSPFKSYLPNDEDVLQGIEKVERFWIGDHRRATQKNRVPEALYYLASTKFISCLDEAMFNHLYARVEWVLFKPGSIVYREGDTADDGMYIITQGSVAVTCKGTHGGGPVRNVTAPAPSVQSDDGSDEGEGGETSVLCELVQGDSFGEDSLVVDTIRRVATYTSTAESMLIRISRKVFNEFVAHHPAVLVSFIKTTIARQWRMAKFVLTDFFDIGAAYCYADGGGSGRSAKKVKMLANSQEKSMSRYRTDALTDFFEVEDPAFKQCLAAENASRQISLKAGQLLFEEGVQPQYKLYLVLEGEVCLCRKGSDHVYKLGPGSVAGEIGYFTGIRHIFTCRALKHSKLSWWDGHDFNVDPQPHLVRIALKVADTLVPMLRHFSSFGLMRDWKRAGDLLYSRGDPPSDIFIVVSGRVRILPGKGGRQRGNGGSVAAENTSDGSSTHGNERQPGHETYEANERTDDVDSLGCAYDDRDLRMEVGRGGCVGEVAFLCQQESSQHGSSTMCLRDSELIRISRGAFVKLTKAYPQIYSKFTKVMARRFRMVLDRSKSPQHVPRFGGFSSNKLCMTVAVIAAGPTVDLRSFGERLTDALQLHGHTVLLRPDVIDTSLGKGTCAGLGGYYQRSRLTYWLTELEEAHRFLVFEADSQITPWTQCCVRTADCLFIVADADHGDPTVSQFEHVLLWQSVSVSRAAAERETEKVVRSGSSTKEKVSSSSSPVHTEITSPIDGKNTGKNQSGHGAAVEAMVAARRLNRYRVRTEFCVKELVLVHNDSTVIPTGTRRWFDGRDVDSFHHVKRTHAGHYARLARYLSGCTVGLVLGGGGARGLAHLGVMKAVRAQNIPVDYIGGTSQGAFMASLYALHPVHSLQDFQVLEQRTREMSTRLGSIWNMVINATLPLMSYFDGSGFSASIKEILGADVKIEDLWIKYFCVTTNISTTDICIHREGSLWRAVRSSMTILDYLPPMFFQGDLLIDGAYINNLPVDVMREVYQPRLVVAVDVENKKDDEGEVTPYGDHLSGWWVMKNRLWNWINPFSKRFRLPKFSEIIYSLMYINHDRNFRQFVKQRLIDLYLRPNLGTTQLLDYHKFEEIVEIGCRFAQRKLLEFRLQHSDVFPRRTRMKRALSVSSIGAIVSQSNVLNELAEHMRPRNASVAGKGKNVGEAGHVCGKDCDVRDCVAGGVSGDGGSGAGPHGTKGTGDMPVGGVLGRKSHHRQKSGSFDGMRMHRHNVLGKSTIGDIYAMTHRLASPALAALEQH